MINIFKILVLVVFVTSCATSTSKHFTMKGEMVFDGGVYKNEKWNDPLVFKKITWVREFTTTYELAYAEITKKSKYFKWFSLGEKAELRAHKKCYVTLAYQEDSDKISHNLMIDEFNRQKFTKIQLLNFKRYIRTHSKAGEYSLHKYNVLGFCTNEDVGEVEISFPNFNTQKL